MAESDAPSRERQDDIELNIPPDEVETQRKRAFVASGLGWGLDGFDLYGALGQALPKDPPEISPGLEKLAKQLG